MTPSITVQPSIRSPMKSLESHENIPLPTTAPAPHPPPKQIQLGIEAFTKKRPADSDTSPKIKKFKTASGEFLPVQSGPDRQTVICHQCRQHTHIPLSIQCTQLKDSGKVTGDKRCVTKYCHRCLTNRYGENATTIKSRGDVLAGHVMDAGYAWSCPACRGICNCSGHRKKMGLQPLGPLRKPTPKEGKDKKEPRENGIQSFFQKAEVNEDRVTPEAAKIPDDEPMTEPGEILPVKSDPKPKLATPRKQKKPVIKVVNPPVFHPVRAMTTDDHFVENLKVCEFVLQFEKLFTRKLRVPTKHVVQLSDPCETPPAITIKHLYIALLKIIQTDLAETEEQDRMKETIRAIEKCASGHENSLAATTEWLKYMDPKHPPAEDNEIAVASKLIDWASCTSTCRDELDNNIEALKTLQKENLATTKTIRTEWDEKKGELHKDRLRIVEKDLVDQWKQSISELDKEYKTEILRLSNELWIESRRLSPRTTPLGSDILGNKYWLFSSRQTKTREFGGWVVIQTPSSLHPTGSLSHPATNPPVNDNEQSQYQDLKSWYYVDKPDDIRQLAKWTMYLAARAAADKETGLRKGSARGSPNKMGQLFAVEVPSPGRMKERPGKGRKVVEYVGIVDARVLGEELVHAAEWIEERWPEVEEEEEVEEKETVFVEGEIIVLDP